MATLTQKILDKAVKVTNNDLSKRSNSMRNYFVAIGDSFPIGWEQVHIGLGSEDHLETIKGLVKDPIFEVREDRRKFKGLTVSANAVSR